MLMKPLREYLLFGLHGLLNWFYYPVSNTREGWDLCHVPGQNLAAHARNLRIQGSLGVSTQDTKYAAIAFKYLQYYIEFCHCEVRQFLNCGPR